MSKTDNLFLIGLIFGIVVLASIFNYFSINLIEYNLSHEQFLNMTSRIQLYEIADELERRKVAVNYFSLVINVLAIFFSIVLIKKNKKINCEILC